jgi:hypothetical protein
MSALRDHDNRAGSRASSILKTFDAFAALRAIRDACSLRATVKAVAFVLIARANASGEAWPGYDTIGRDAGVDRRTAISAVAALESAGFIEKVARRTEEGDDDTNLYRLRIGLPARPREESAAAQFVQVEACEPANDVQAPQADAAQLVQVEAPRAAAGPCEPDADVQAPRADAAQLVQVEESGKKGKKGSKVEEIDYASLPPKELTKHIKKLEEEMRYEAEMLNFEMAASIRDTLKDLKKLLA